MKRKVDFYNLGPPIFKRDMFGIMLSETVDLLARRDVDR